MEDKPYYELNNAEFLPWIINFITVILANQSVLPITHDQITALEARRDSHQAKLNAQIAAEQAAQAATRDINDDRVLSNAEVGFFNTTFKATKTIPRELLIEMGLKVSDGRTSPPPADPLELTVTAYANGNNELKWLRNGNKPNTIFDIEAQIGDSTEWVHIKSTTETSFTHTDQKPGVQVVYRVRATRDGRESAWSNTAVAYFKG